MEKKHHYFLAIKIPKEIKTFLHAWINQKRSNYPFIKWVHPDDYHITLVFLGFVDEKKREELIEEVQKTISKEKTFQLTINNLGIFGSTKNPRIFWAGVNESESLNLLQKKLYDKCEELQLFFDKKAFNPHITLARKWGREESFSEEKLISITSDKGNPYSFFVNEVVLYETHLDKSPKYKEYALFPLI